MSRRLHCRLGHHRFDPRSQRTHDGAYYGTEYQTYACFDCGTRRNVYKRRDLERIGVAGYDSAAVDHAYRTWLRRLEL